MPQLYCRDEFPESDEKIGAQHAPPKLTLSKVENVILFPRHVAISHDSKVLPQTFLRGRYKHHGGIFRADDGERYHLKAPSDLSIHTRVTRPLYFADTDKPDVFGHVLLEVLPRLWALDEVRREALVTTSVRAARNYDVLFRAMGVDPNRIVRIERPVVADQVLFPSLPIIRRSTVHPKAFEVFDRIKRLAKTGDVPSYERIYVSRSKVPGRDLVNEPEVEAYFRSKGFFIVHPQEHTIENQIRLFANAKLVASVGGSGAHSAVFSSNDAKVLILSSTGWLVNADMLLSQVPGRLGYVFGEPLEDLHLKRNKAAWRISLADVAMATKAHFEI
jgi:capsular polysaccharide biosynthesis protein